MSTAAVTICPRSGCPTDERRALDGGVIRVDAEAEPGGLCDLVHHEAWVRNIVENEVMETLFEEDATGKITPRLVETSHWEGQGNDHRLVLTLRRGVSFHDGAPFDSSDVVFTLRLAMDEKLGADAKTDLANLTLIEATDARTVTLHLRAPSPFLMQSLAHLAMYPRHLLVGIDLRTAAFCRAPIGTGPFRFSSWASGSTLTLARFDRYWGKRPRLDGIEFRFVRDRRAAYLLYRRGELDVVRLPLEHDPIPAPDRVYRVSPNAFFFALWNTRRPCLTPPRVRVALAHLVDVPRLVESAFHGAARPHSGPFLEGTPSYDETIVPYSYDLEGARETLATSDAPRKLTFLSTVGSVASEHLGSQLEEGLRKLGIELGIEKLDFAALLDRVRRHDFDVTALQLTLEAEQDNFGLFHSSAVDEENWAGFSDVEVDALLSRIRETEVPVDRHRLDRKLHFVLHERGPMTFLVAPEVDIAVSRRWGGVRPSSNGFDLANAFRVAP